MTNTLAATAFAPHEALAAALLPHLDGTDDGSHDLAHIARVFRNALRIHEKEGGDGRILIAAVLLHDCVAVEKSSPLRAQASRLAAERAAVILDGLGWRGVDCARVHHAILTHSFSAGLEPQTLEAKILQDADRLDALGAIGAARCFYTAGRMGSALYDAADPQGQARALDDRAFAIDHFPAKLFRLAEGFKTDTGQAMARERHARLVAIYEQFLDEI